MFSNARLVVVVAGQGRRQREGLPALDHNLEGTGGRAALRTSRPNYKENHLGDVLLCLEVSAIINTICCQET